MAEVQDESKIEKQEEEQQQQSTVTGEVIQTEIVKLTVVKQNKLPFSKKKPSLFVGK